MKGVLGVADCMKGELGVADCIKGGLGVADSMIGPEERPGEDACPLDQEFSFPPWTSHQ